jgi:hypothetical protein
VEEEPERRNRGLAIAFVLCAAGAGLALWAVTQPWGVALVHRVTPLPPVSQTILGREAAPISTALALVALAGALALLALKRIGRTILGVLLALCGLGILIDAVAGLTGSALRPASSSATVTVAPMWAVLAIGGGVLVLVGGLWIALRAGTWTSSARYELPTAKPRVTAGVATDAETWDALDRGEDPTHA